MFKRCRSIGILMMCSLLGWSGELPAQAMKVELQNQGDNWTLLRGGEPFFIQGAGGLGSKKLLREMGGNSFRTWGAEGLDVQLDEAQKLGLAVTAGIWMTHERHGFDYKNRDMVAAQLERARQTVLKYRDHPALLLWGVGNEMEGFAEGDDPAIWSAVNEIAAMIKELDPNHPTMTVVAEIGGARVKSIHRLCPAIDVVGINSYGGGRTLARRYRAAGGTKPFIITEFGPPGTWESKQSSWGAPLELSSTAKASWYRATYEGSVLAEREKLCLGSYAFNWGNKQEATATWFGLFLPDGARLEAIDTMRELWSGTRPANRCPQIKSVEVLGTTRVDPGATVRASVEASDQEQAPLKIRWELHKDTVQYQLGGDVQPTPPTYPDAIAKSTGREVELRMPGDPGGYWLYAFVYDDKGGAAVANVPLYVDEK